MYYEGKNQQSKDSFVNLIMSKIRTYDLDNSLASAQYICAYV